MTSHNGYADIELETCFQRIDLIEENFSSQRFIQYQNTCSNHDLDTRDDLKIMLNSCDQAHLA